VTAALQFRNLNGLVKAVRAAQVHFKPPPDLKPSDWAEANVKIPIGNAVPGLIRFDNAPYQREPLNMTADPSCQRITLQWGAQVGKALDVNTPIPTPEGFTLMRDIRPGDRVLSETGLPCRVTLATDIMHNRDCYRVVFDDGSDVVCDAEHLWTVVDRGHKIRGRLTGREITLTLAEMIEPHERSKKQGRTRYAVKNAEPAQHAAKDLPVDPYLYGLWLGDGCVGDGQLVVHRDDMELVSLIRARGHAVEVRYKDQRNGDVGYCRVTCRTGDPLAKVLRVKGLRTKDAIDQNFLTSSVQDRRDMLAGLMDTDGYASDRGHVEFINKSKVVADAVFRLASSLGYKPRMRKVSKSCRYKGAVRTGEYWKISFRAYAQDGVFRISRKQRAIEKSESGRSYLRRSESRQRGIKEIIAVPSVPVKCIQVDSPSRLYLCSHQYIPTHNTMLALCAQSYRIAQNPCSQIMMQPSQGDLTTWLETKFNPLVENNDQLQELIAKPRGRDGVNNQRMKSYPGGFMMFSWSGSPKTMRGRSAPFIVCDETDGYDRTNEGHPVGLLWQRAATFGDQRLLLEISTPTTKGASWIESSFEQGDQRRFHVACPHCGEHQPLKWQNVTWEQDEEGNHLPETARYMCMNGCAPGWTDAERIAAIRTAEEVGAGWKAAKPFRGHASYHLNELYSTFRRLGDIVQSFLDKKAAGDLQTFVNVSLAETWEERGDQVDSTGLIERAEKYRAPVPAGGLVLTSGVDMQQDRLEVETVAWGLGDESWSVDYQVLWGDPLQGDVWDDLDDYLAKTWMHQSGAQLPISAACLDTGGNSGYTQAAYEYAKGKTGRRLFAIKGVGGWGRPIVSAPSRKRTGRGQRPVDLFTVGTDEAKMIVAKRLAIKAPGPGYCHFPDERDAEWFHQITAEKLITKYIKGFPIREWHKTRDRNEAFDCRVYALAALKILNPNMARLAKRLVVEDDQEDSQATDEEWSQQVADTANKLRDVLTSNRVETKTKPSMETTPEEESKPVRKTKRIRQSSRARKSGKRKGGWVNGW
jgi:phage terminase large subunit GpA-like protein